jgi:hypothetical protein
MADATQELMLRVRGDNSGADKAISDTKNSIDGLKVSGEKATGAFKNFSKSLAEARDASDVAASAANSLSNIVGKSLMGAFAVGGVKLFTDQINRMGESIKAVATEAQQAFDNIEKAGQAMSLSEATSQVSQLDALLASTGKKLSELDRSPFQNFIAGATGARSAMEELVATSQKLRDMKLAEGLATENANAEFAAGLDEQATQIAKVNAEYEKRSRIAQTFTDKEAYRIYQEASAAQKVRETNAIIDAMAQKAAQENEKNTQEKIKLNQELGEQSKKNIDEQIKKEEALAELQQKRFNDLYEFEIKAQEATQKRIDANIKAQEEEQRKSDEMQKEVSEAKKVQEKSVGAGATELSARPAGQRETSFQRGLRESIPRAEEQGRREAREAVRKDIGEQLKTQGRPSGSQDIDREIARVAKEEARQRGMEETPGFRELKQVREAQAQQAKAEIQRIDQMAKSASDFETNLSDLGTGFDEAMNSASNLADSMTKNGGNMVDDFLKGGESASKLSDGLDKATDSVGKLSEELKKSGPSPGGGARPGEKGKETGSLASIEKLLQKNFDELKAYAHAT